MLHAPPCGHGRARARHIRYGHISHHARKEFHCVNVKMPIPGGIITPVDNFSIVSSSCAANSSIPPAPATVMLSKLNKPSTRQITSQSPSNAYVDWDGQRLNGGGGSGSNVATAEVRGHGGRDAEQQTGSGGNTITSVDNWGYQRSQWQWLASFILLFVRQSLQNLQSLQEVIRKPSGSLSQFLPKSL